VELLEDVASEFTPELSEKVMGYQGLRLLVRVIVLFCGIKRCCKRIYVFAFLSMLSGSKSCHAEQIVMHYSNI
jgi:hypothetical protein